MRTFLLLFFVFAAFTTRGQNRVSLLPNIMINYIGKATQSEFEKLVGDKVDNNEELGTVIYEVENTYDNIVTALQCIYRKSDGILISIRFSTPHYLAYWINMANFKGFTEKKNATIKKDTTGNLIKLDLKYKNFGCQIFDFQQWSRTETTATINYHVIKL